MKMIVSYDKEEDILYISQSSKNIKYSVGVGDLFVIDFDDKDRVVGVEILDASEAIAGISKQVLENIAEVGFTAKYTPELIVIGLAIKSKTAQKQIFSSLAVPMIARS